MNDVIVNGAPLNSITAKLRATKIYTLYCLWLLLSIASIIVAPTCLAVLLYYLFKEIGAPAAPLMLTGIPIALIGGLQISFQTLRDARQHAHTPCQRSDLPWVDEILSALETDLGTRVVKFTHIVITHDAGLCTYQFGRIRILEIGLMTAIFMPTNLLRAVLAHEYGHHFNDSMIYHRAIWYVERAAMRWLNSINRVCGAWDQKVRLSVMKYNYLAANAVMRPGIIVCFKVLELGLSFFKDHNSRRLHHDLEFFCDDVASRLTSDGEFGAALLNVATLQEIYSLFCAKIAMCHALSANQNDTELYAFLKLAKSRTVNLTQQAAMPSESHPALIDRIKHKFESPPQLNLIRPIIAADAESRIRSLPQWLHILFKLGSCKDATRAAIKTTAGEIFAATGLSDVHDIAHLFTILTVLHRRLSSLNAVIRLIQRSGANAGTLRTEFADLIRDELLQSPDLGMAFRPNAKAHFWAAASTGIDKNVSQFSRFLRLVALECERGECDV
ncbi:MAG TPA: M48 family metalloprotease [Polyangium sp.]|nr:M48 family metalloprotease [Polyangium sp.]